jgi:hypothetical protein
MLRLIRDKHVQQIPLDLTNSARFLGTFASLRACGGGKETGIELAEREAIELDSELGVRAQAIEMGEVRAGV